MRREVSVVEFEDFVTARGPALLRFATVLTGDPHRAEDVVQAVLGRAYPKWRRIGGTDHPEAYVRRMVLNEYLSWRRRKAATEVVGEVADRPDRADHAERSADHDELRQRLAGLPRRQRAVLVLRYYEDLPDDEIAELLGCAQGTVRAAASRGLAALRTTSPTDAEARR